MNDHVVHWSSWVFTAITALVLILVLTVSFMRFRRRRQRQREKEREYVARLKLNLPGFNRKDYKKTLARKIMTNTHVMGTPETFAASMSQTSVNPDYTSHLAPIAKPEYTEGIVGLSKDVTLHHHDTRNPDNSRHAASQNSFDTTTDEEKPLVDVDKDRKSLTKVVRDGKLGLQACSPRLEKTDEHVMTSKRKQMLKPEAIVKGQGKNLNVRSNFTSAAVTFEDEHLQDYVLYTTEDLDDIGTSEPFIYTFPSHTDIETYPSMPAMDVNSYYIDTGMAPPPRHKSKQSKSHKTGRKKHRKLGEGRARSLPQLDDAFYGNILDDQKPTEVAELYKEYPRQSTSGTGGKIFMKRKPLTPQKALRQGDNSAPLIRMRSFPVVSQNENTTEAELDEATFISEYM